MGKYDKYICTQLFKRDMLPGPTPEERDKIAAEGKRISMEHVLWIDDDIIPGAYYGESTWIWPPSYPNQITFAEQLKRTANPKPMFPHAHDFPELLSWWGTDPDHPEDTSTMGMLMDDEEIRLDTSWVAYIPAGMLHMPTRPQGNARVTARPVCHWTSGPGGVYTREKDEKAAAGEKALEAQRAGLPTNIKRSGNLKNARYMIYGYRQNAKRPSYMSPIDLRYMRPVAYIDQEDISDAEFGCDTFWLLPGYPSGKGQLLMDKHTLPYGTSLTITAMNYADITDLCAEVELWIGGEKHIINKSFGAYIPPDVEQGPLIIRNIKSQLFFMMSQPIGEGIKKYRGK
jgi:hypothetical protein